nr:transposase [Escherichia coli]
MVKLASQLGASVARIAREHDINDNLCSNGSGSGRTKGVYRGVFR